MLILSVQLDGWDYPKSIASEQDAESLDHNIECYPFLVTGEDWNLPFFGMSDLLSSAQFRARKSLVALKHR